MNEMILTEVKLYPSYITYLKGK